MIDDAGHWSYTPAGFLTFGGNAAEAAQEALKDGPFGLFWRRQIAREFQACKTSVDLSGIHTTCAVFASACWFWGGRPVRTRAGHIGGPIVGGWLEGLIAPGPYWIENKGGALPETGDIVCYGPRPLLIHHVELSLDKSTDGTIWTAHGGDYPRLVEIERAHLTYAQVHEANGTVARLGEVQDSTARKPLEPPGKHGVCGWFSAARVAEAESLG